MTIKEILVNLLKVPIHPRIDADPAEVVADYLLDNGVTVQQWVPMSERKPTNADTNSRGEVLAWFDNHAVVWNITNVLCAANITHWMPLPERPKEET